MAAETASVTYPYQPIAVDWKRPPIDRDILRHCIERSDLQGLWHSLGTLAILTASGTFTYLMFVKQQWLLMALGLYVHGGLFAFQPQTHEFSHNTVFKTPWLNRFFKRVFGFVHWRSNSALYKMSHTHHHRYTVHRRSDGEVVLPAPEPAERILETAVRVVDPTALIISIYDSIHGLFSSFPRNTRRNAWMRYVYANSPRNEQRDAYWTGATQFLAHVAFAVFALATHRWFLIVVVSLPAFYGAKWYHQFVHDTMHCGREPDVDDFRKCCRTVRVDPFTSFLYWHMEWHTEHHAFAGIPCYRLKRFHELTREHWDAPQSLVRAWHEMDRHSKQVMAIPVAPSGA